jgi:hypothetical protein
VCNGPLRKTRKRRSRFCPRLSSGTTLCLSFRPALFVFSSYPRPPLPFTLLASLSPRFARNPDDDSNNSNDSNDVPPSLYKLPCGHEFHNDCLQPWLAEHITCPLCRTLVARNLGVQYLGEPIGCGVVIQPFLIFLSFSPFSHSSTSPSSHPCCFVLSLISGRCPAPTMTGSQQDICAVAISFARTLKMRKGCVTV